MTYEELIPAAQEYGVSISPELQEKLKTYAKLLKEWNEKMNLTAIVEEPEVIEKHFLDSLTCAAVYDFSGKSVADIGSGAGFPGIIIALAVVCTGFGYTLQPVAQSHTTAQRAGLFCALSPAFATIFGAVLLREKITPLGLVGILLILGSLLLPHFIKGKKCHDEVQSSPL